MVRVEIAAYLSIFYLIVWHSRLCISNRMYDVIVTRVACEDYNSSIVYNVSCTTRNLNRTTKAHSLSGYILPNISLNEIFVRITFHQRINTGYRRLIIDSEENFCAFRNGTSKSLVMSIMWPFLKAHSNLDHKCPFSGFIYVSNFIIRFDHFPPALPEGEGKVTVHLRNGPQRASLIKVAVYAEIKPKGAATLNF
ncbi:unnamed protein product [Hermetia illucens]|uniref:MD-2-related lipid-recognition domain-containing protein n=1 Tax=Hermetia illucens TaxID=343691 RepID=A0A7R8YY89_HERIL|nr:uncharacterized protein LOC119656931 [Hermetia illucens]CAD7089838.1 unnamed protein product [Hermetia illucens]